MADKVFEYFYDDVVFTGKHKRYIDEMWEQNKISNSFFKRLLDMYVIAAIIGLRLGKTVPADFSEEKRTIQTTQLLGYLPVLKSTMTLVLALDKTRKLSDAEKIDNAFRKPETQKEFDANVNLFNGYARAGIEYLHDALVVRVLGIDDNYRDPRVGNIIALLNDPLIPLC